MAMAGHRMAIDTRNRAIPPPMGMVSDMPEAVPLVRANGLRKGNMRPRVSLCLDVGRPDHLAPLLGFIGDELAEVGG